MSRPMTDPTTPTTFPVAKSLLARLERYAPPDEYGGWHEWLDAVIEEARDGYVPASLSPEWHAELNYVREEAIRQERARLAEAVEREFAEMREDDPDARWLGMTREGVLALLREEDTPNG